MALSPPALPAACASATATRRPRRLRPHRLPRLRARPPRPNGAGKSTAVHTLATLTRIDEGEARVAGYDVRTRPAQVRAAIGLVGQSAALDEILFGRENLVMFGRLHGLSTAEARTRAAELLTAFDLDDAAGRKVSTYSGGMRRRLDIAAGLITRPAVLFLDEPTTGPRPARPGRRVAGRPPGGGAGHHGAAHDPVPRRGRPAGRPDHRDGRRARDRRGHARGAEVQARRRPGARRAAADADADHRAAAVAPSGLDVRHDDERGELVVEAGSRRRHRGPPRRRPGPRRGGRRRPRALREPTLDEVFLHLPTAPPPPPTT